MYSKHNKFEFSEKVSWFNIMNSEDVRLDIILSVLGLDVKITALRILKEIKINNELKKELYFEMQYGKKFS